MSKNRTCKNIDLARDIFGDLNEHLNEIVDKNEDILQPERFFSKSNALLKMAEAAMDLCNAIQQDINNEIDR